MTRAEMIATLEREQAADNASPWAAGHKWEVQASAIESGDHPDLPDWLDSQPDPAADVVGEAIAREKLARWEAESGGAWMPDRPRETIGAGLVGWSLDTEAATLIGQPCPCCGDHPGPGRVCLACTRAGGRLDSFLESLLKLSSEWRPDWPMPETEGERAALVDEAGRQGQSLAERRFSGREARRASQGPPRAKPGRPGRVHMVNHAGQAREVRPSMVGAYQATGWRVA